MHAVSDCHLGTLPLLHACTQTGHACLPNCCSRGYGAGGAGAACSLGGLVVMWLLYIHHSASEILAQHVQRHSRRTKHVHVPPLCTTTPIPSPHSQDAQG